MKSIFKTKSKKTIIILILSIISLVFFSSIVYSAFSSTMNISGLAHARVEADVRITDFSLSEVVNATSGYEEFGKDNISTSISFNSNAYAIYKVEVTNYGESDIGIYNITGIPENITYELIDYNLKDKICDDIGKCNTFAIKTFYIKFSGSNIEKEFTLNFNFQIIHNVTYKNFTGNYKSYVFDGETISVNISQDSPKFVYVKSNDNLFYSYQNNILTLNNINSDVSVEAVNDLVNEYDYTGSVQSLVIPYEGLYKIELWGSGGFTHERIYSETVGKGAYTSGNIYLTEEEQLHFYVGGTDEFNGRGVGEATGGSATDVRLVFGEWNNFESLKSRIMVAAGGGGGVYNGGPYEGDSPGDAGGLNGYDANFNSRNRGYGYSGYGAKQTEGGKSGKDSGFYEMPSTANGRFGEGGYAVGESSSASGIWGRSSGGGSGYYGGGHGFHPGDTWPGAGGGSSFISGHIGCDAVSEISTSTNIIHTGQSVHYSGYKFKDTVMIDGRGYSWTDKKLSTVNGMPTFDGLSTMIGNTETGYAKITLIQIKNQYSVTYFNIEGDYQSTIYKGEDLIVDFGNNAPISLNILVGETKTNDYIYTNGVLTIADVSDDIKITGIYSNDFEYTGTPQIFTAPYSGIYKVELWGAQGTGQGGKGGYVSGNIQLTNFEQLYVYVGGQTSLLSNDYSIGGYNGGGAGTYYGINSGGYSYAGGGATDIRLIGGEWNSFDGLKSRIMVAAGGAGEQYKENFLVGSIPGYGGGLLGGNAGGNYYVDGLGHKFIHPFGASQVSGGIGDEDVYDGMFGMAIQIPSDNCWGSGGGGGYYGGAYGCGSVGSGGSSFISGHNGCDALLGSSTSSNIVHTGQSVHYSGYAFTNTTVIDGGGYMWTDVKGSSVVGMPTYNGTSTMIGNTGNGYAKITLIEIK